MDFMTKRSSGELKRLAREFLMGKYTIPILVMLIAEFLPAVVLAPFSFEVSAKINAASVIYIVAALIVRVLGRLLSIGIVRIHMMLARDQQISYKDLFWTFGNQPDRFILAILLLGSILFIPAVPAIACGFYLRRVKTILSYVCLSIAVIVLTVVDLYIAYMFELIFPLYIDHPQMNVLEGFRNSQALMRGNKRRLFLLQLSFIGWQMLGLCSIGIGLLWIKPYMMQTSVNFYLDVTGQFDKKAEHMDAEIAE